MKQRLLLLILAGFFCLPSYAQSIKGKIKLNEDWKRAIYLIEISNYQMAFTGNSNNVVDSFYASSEGYFYFEKLKPKTLYRLNVIPKSTDVTGMLIQDGVNDNYAFFVTNSSQKQLYFVGDIASLLRSSKIVSSDSSLNMLQKQVAAIRDIKLPVYDLMAALGKEMDHIPTSDTSRILEFQQQAIPQIMSRSKETNVLLLDYLQKADNPEIISLGLIYDDFEQNNADKRITGLVRKIKPYEKRSLVASIISRVGESAEEIDFSFLTKEYALLNGSKIRLDTLNTRFTLLDFWASWCLPCRKAINGDLKTLSSKFSKNELQIIGVNIDQDKEKAKVAIKKDNNVHPQIWESVGGHLYTLFKIKAIPHYILIDNETHHWEVVRSAELLQGIIKEKFFGK